MAGVGVCVVCVCDGGGGVGGGGGGVGWGGGGGGGGGVGWGGGGGGGGVGGVGGVREVLLAQKVKRILTKHGNMVYHIELIRKAMFNFTQQHQLSVRNISLIYGIGWAIYQSYIHVVVGYIWSDSLMHCVATSFQATDVGFILMNHISIA